MRGISLVSVLLIMLPAAAEAVSEGLYGWKPIINCSVLFCSMGLSDV